MSRRNLKERKVIIMERIAINKNRGWRGLAEVVYTGDAGTEIQKMIFSFSQPVWEDLLKGFIVLQDKDNYTVLEFDNIEALPKPTQQRSVLIKNFSAEVVNKQIYQKTSWTQPAMSHGHYAYISNFIKNRNNHTTSDWNCIGIRVLPNI